MKFLKYFLILLLLLVLFFFGKGMLTPTIDYDCSIMVDKPATECWMVMSDTSKSSQWIKGFIKTELVSGTVNTVGAVSNVYIEDQGQESIIQETITTFKPNQHMGMSFTMDFMNMEYDIMFEDNGDKTKISTTTKTSGNGLFSKSIISFMGGSMVDQENENLQNLKKLIEENTTDYFKSEETELTN